MSEHDTEVLDWLMTLPRLRRPSETFQPRCQWCLSFRLISVAGGLVCPHCDTRPPEDDGWLDPVDGGPDFWEFSEWQFEDVCTHES